MKDKPSLTKRREVELSSFLIADSQSLANTSKIRVCFCDEGSNFQKLYSRVFVILLSVNIRVKKAMVAGEPIA